MANPLIKLELMRRFRSPAAAWGIPLVVLLPGITVVVVYATTIATRDRFAGMAGGPVMMGDNGGMMIDQTGIRPSELQGVGLGMFTAVVAALALTLLVLVPAMVGGSIAGERHSQTLQPLQLTAMTPTQIVLGKLVSSLAYLVLALACAAPVLVIPFLLGGLSATQVIGAYVVLVLVTFEFAAVSLAVSSIMSRPAPAIIVSLLVCGFLTIAPWIATGLAFAASANDPFFDAGDSALRFIAGFSPVSLGSWVLDASQEDVRDVVETGDKIGSLLWFLVISIGSLAIARSRVVAPVDRDR
jgi:ABC-type transport system involved in multi-copper enzyme maturation permease subunit